jgi:hypothetical protein
MPFLPTNSLELLELWGEVWPYVVAGAFYVLKKYVDERFEIRKERRLGKVAKDKPSNLVDPHNMPLKLGK